MFFTADRNLVPEHQRRREDIEKLKPGHKLTQLVLSCLENDKHNRPTATELREQLDQLRRWQEIRNNATRLGDIRFRIALLGSSGVGKSVILQRHLSKKFVESRTTVVDIETETVTFKNKQIKLYFVDTAGQERFQSGGVTPVTIRDADGVILVFDLSDRQSFDSLDQWNEMITTYCSANAVVILVGNKNDKESRAVSSKEAEIYGKTKGLSQYYETSAVTGENIEALFERMVELIYDELQLDSVVLRRKKETPIPPKKWWQCFE